MTDCGGQTYTLTAHAASVVAERKLDLAWVERVLEHPVRTEVDRHDPNLRHALARVPEHGNRVLRVVYDPRASPLRIITVYFDRTLRNKL